MIGMMWENLVLYHSKTVLKETLKLIGISAVRYTGIIISLGKFQGTGHLVRFTVKFIGVFVIPRFTCKKDMSVFNGFILPEIHL